MCSNLFFSRGLFFDCELGNLLKVCDSGVLTFHKKKVQEPANFYFVKCILKAHRYGCLINLEVQKKCYKIFKC